MNGLPYYKAYPRDFLEGTIGMSFEMKGSYRLVLDLIYLHNGQLIDNSQYIAGQLGMSVRQWNRVKKSLLDVGKIDVSCGLVQNERATNELLITKSFQSKQSLNRARPNKTNDLESPRLMSESPNHHPTDTDISKKEKDTTYPKREPPKRTSRLPEDWMPDAEALAYGVERIGEHETQRQLVNFKDWWPDQPGAKGRKMNWTKTWQRWIRKAEDDGRNRTGGRRGSNGGSPIIDAVRHLIAAEHDKQSHAGKPLSGAAGASGGEPAETGGLFESGSVGGRGHG